MLRGLRRSRHNFWLALLALLATLPASSPAWHDPGDDPVCNPAVVVHNHAAHRIAAATSGHAAPEHCAVCHWLQTLRGATHASGFVAPSDTSARLPIVIPVSTVASILPGRSGRAPPLS